MAVSMAPYAMAVMMAMMPTAPMHLTYIMSGGCTDAAKVGAGNGGIRTTHKTDGQRCKSGRSNQTLCHTDFSSGYPVNGRPNGRLS